MYKEIIPIRLKEARKRSGLTQTEVAKLLGLKQGTLTNYETAKITPSAEVLGKLAEFYGVSLDWIFGLVQPQGTSYQKELQNRDSILKDMEREAKRESRKVAI